MSKKLGQEPAFARPFGEVGDTFSESQEGMSKRFYAACAAMQGILSNKRTLIDQYHPECFPEEIVHNAYVFADELLKQENQ